MRHAAAMILMSEVQRVGIGLAILIGLCTLALGLLIMDSANRIMSVISKVPRPEWKWLWKP